MLQVVISIPINSVTCEISFSSMSCIDNWLRTSTLRYRVTNSAVLDIERDVVNFYTYNKSILIVYCAKDIIFCNMI